jgi:hypothetical protein
MNIEVLSEKTKICTKCHKRKKAHEYNKGRSNCKTCQVKYNKAWRYNRTNTPKSTGTRKCSKCNRRKKISNYPPDMACRDGRKLQCYSCVTKNRQYISQKVGSINKRDHQYKLSTKFLRTQLTQQSNSCYYCGCALITFSIDHKLPRSRGGTNKESNIVLTCGDCNHLKFTRTETEFKVFLNEYMVRVNSNRRLWLDT